MPHIALPVHSSPPSPLLTPSRYLAKLPTAFKFPRHRLVFPLATFVSLLVLIWITFRRSSHPVFSTVSFDATGIGSSWDDKNGTLSIVRLVNPKTIRYTPGAISREAEVPWYQEPVLEAPSSDQYKRGVASVQGLPVFPRHVELDATAPKADQLFFGVATNAKRAMVVSHLWPHWLSPTASSPSPPSCLVLLPLEDFAPSPVTRSSPASVLKAHLRSLGLEHCHVETTHEPHTERYELRYFALAKEMYKTAKKEGKGREEDVKWWIVGDDDTFWLDQRTLRRELGTMDPNQKFFVGGTTEARAQFDTFGVMAYGGAGIIMSKAQHKAMLELSSWCLEEFKGVFGGDGVYTRCAARAMGSGATPGNVTTFLPGLHQVDVPGDGTGFLQSGLPWISLHHAWNGWVDFFTQDHPVPDFPHLDNHLNQLLLIAQVAQFLGGDNLFRRYVFAGGKEMVTLGYTVTIFEKPLVKEDLTVLEYTWSYEYDYHLFFPDRPRRIEAESGTAVDDQMGKNTYYLTQVIVNPDAPGRAILRHVDRWKRYVDLVWEEP